MARRQILRAIDASNEGVRRLRMIRRTRTSAMIARKVGCTERSVRHWEREERTPHPEWREALEKEFGIPASAWEDPLDDVPPTEKA